MKIKPILYVVVILVVLLTLLFYFSSILAEECKPEACITYSGMAGVNGCILETGERTGCVIPIHLDACSTRDGKLMRVCCYENNALTVGVDPDSLELNDLIVFDVNLQRAVSEFKSEIENYVVCVKSDIEELDDIYLPPNYFKTEKYNGLFCSPEFSVNEFHHLSLYGRVDKKGKFNMAEIYLFEQDFETTEEFYFNLDKSAMIFSLEVDV